MEEAQEQKIEKIKKSSDGRVNNGGPREGAGRKVGGKNFSTIHKEKIHRGIKERIASVADKLINAQIYKALGEAYLFCVVTEKNEDTGKATRKTHQITDVDIIIQFLDGDFNNKGDDEYYFIQTKEIDTRAIDSLLDRGFGKANQSIDIGDGIKTNPYKNLSDEELLNQINELEEEPEVIEGGTTPEITREQN